METRTDPNWQRIGVIVPSGNTMVEADFWRSTPPGTTVHAARMYLEETTAEDEMRMVTRFAPDAIRDIVTSRPNVIVFGCTSAGATLGQEGEQNLIESIRQAAGVPVVSINSAVARALRKRGITRPGVITAYIPELTANIVKVLNERGFNVPQSHGLGIIDVFEIAEVTPEQILSFAKEHISLDGIDGLFISCANLRAMEAVEALEAWSGLPVVTSNLAAVEQALEELKQL